MPEHVYLVMRDEGLRSDGYYYESNTSIVGIRTTFEDAQALLIETSLKICPDDEEWIRVYKEDLNEFELERFLYDDLSDVLWIERCMIGPAGDIDPTKKGE